MGLLSVEGCDAGLEVTPPSGGRVGLAGNALSLIVGVGGTTLVEGMSSDAGGGRLGSFFSSAGLDPVGVG